MRINEEEYVRTDTRQTGGTRSGRGFQSVWAGVALTAVAALGLAACSSDPGADQTASSTSADSITVYSGRSENLIGPLLADFTAETGVPVDVRYGDSADLALLIATSGGAPPDDARESVDRSWSVMAIARRYTRLTPRGR